MGVILTAPHWHVNCEYAGVEYTGAPLTVAGGRGAAIGEALRLARGDMGRPEHAGARLGPAPENGDIGGFMVGLYPTTAAQAGGALIKVYEGWECWDDHRSDVIPDSQPLRAGLSFR